MEAGTKDLIVVISKSNFTQIVEMNFSFVGVGARWLKREMCQPISRAPCNKFEPVL
jgi:hypothetical protein